MNFVLNSPVFPEIQELSKAVFLYHKNT